MPRISCKACCADERPRTSHHALIQFDNVTKRYPGGVEALRHVTLDIPSGEMAFVTGRSGAGKSTLLRLALGIERASEGQLFINGQNIYRLPKRRMPYLRRNIGMVFQEHRLLRARTVYDNVALPLVIAGASAKEAARRVRAALDQVGLLGKEALMPMTLSAGEQQRVGIARAVVNRPRILLADEPTGNLDPELSLEIIHLFKRFNDVGVTVVIATHDLASLATTGARQIVLHEGVLAGGG